MKKLKLIIGILVGLLALAGGLASFDARWAKASYVEQLALRLDQKIIEDRLDSVQERMWKLEDRYGIHKDQWPPEIRDEYRKLEREAERLKIKLKEKP